MKFPFRAAMIIAVTLASTLAAAGAPGLAITPDKPLFTGLSIPDPAPAQPVNGMSAQIVPNPLTTTEEAPAEPSVARSDDAAISERRDFRTLAAAVAAQARPASHDDNLHCMAGAIYFESKGEPLAGQLAVAQVILNRTKSGRFPKSICSVVTQRGQFSFVRGGRMPNVNRSSAAYQKALAVARVAVDELWDSQAGKALYFHATSVSPRWRMARVAAIGHHVFYR